MEVCGQEFTDKIITRINRAVEIEPLISRRALSRQVCEWVGWKSYNGQLKEMSCRKALLKLHRSGLLNLPELKEPFVFFQKRKKKAENYPEIAFISGELEELGKIELVAISNRRSRLSGIWKSLMDRHHYLGSGPLCGAQIRYLINSSRYGWLGALAFSGAAWRISSRDEWIGWTEEERRNNLFKIASNSRFLILPQVRVPNLASYVLSRIVRRLPGDWFDRYGYSPVLLETFVECNRFSGTCYRAANWYLAGVTSGRGRQDQYRLASVAIKDIFMYPLRKDWRAHLCLTPSSMPATQEGVAEESFMDWAEEEFGRANFGDRRLQIRLLTLARDFYNQPQSNIPQSCGSRSKAKAAYRFFDHKSTTMEHILKSHYESTVRRSLKERVVLAVQDTTSLNYTAHPATENLGPIAYRRDGSFGLLVHDTMAFNVDGTPLGLLDVQCWARDPEDFGKKVRRKQLPIDQKESNKWLKSFTGVAKAQKQNPQTTFVSIGDREADIYELFLLARKESSGPKLLVRAEHNRILSEEQGHLWEKMSKEPISGIQELRVPRQGNRPARLARISIRFSQVQLKPPASKSKLNPVTLWAVWAKEIEAPSNVRALEWMLLTTLKVTTFKHATEKLCWYALRWGIEVYHRTMKSGCKIENRQLGHADRIESCLAIDMVVAWRIYHLTKLGRETPDVPCTVFFQEEEWKALTAYVTKNPVPPDKPPTLREAIRKVATLGGFLGRKSDGEPGTKSLWIGLQRLDDISEMWKVMVNLVPYPKKMTVSSKWDYG